MSRGLQQTKRRIKSVISTKKITGAMELVATAKLKVWKNKMLENRKYSEELLALMQDVVRSVKDKNFAFRKENPVSGRLYIVITSSLGLCSGYNYNIFKMVDGILTEDDEVLILGVKGGYHFRYLEDRLIDAYLDAGATFDYKTAKQIGEFCLKRFDEMKYRSIELIYTHYINSLTFIPKRFTLLPVVMPKNTANLHDDEIIMEPNPATILEKLVPLYLKSMLYGKVIEASVSEHASRRTAMETASDNAEEILDELTLEYNKDRQAAITQEITEIVSGANGQ